jgi:hypothetical protein
MPDEDQRYTHQRPVIVMISAEGMAARLAELAVKRYIYRSSAQRASCRNRLKSLRGSNRN